MEANLASANEKNEFVRRWELAKAKVFEFPGKAKKLAQDDPRRISHSFKVGLAISLVSLFYYFDPLYVGFGSSAMWAVLTVILVFEFSVGATLGKGLNRGLATIFAGTLGLGAHYLATLTGQKVQPILLALFVFIVASAVSFIRFFPRMKARYDYGLLIFLLTFCLISVSGYRDEEVLGMAQNRVFTIIIGGLTALFVCIFIYPVWAGDDLHNLTANNIEKLGIFLQGFGDEFFHKTGDQVFKKGSLQGYKSILNSSKQSEESLANFARWEPPHGKFKFRHPWKQYQNIGSLTRQCAYIVEALNGYVCSDLKTSPEILEKVQDACIKMSSESGKAMEEMASAIRTMSRPPSDSPHIAKSEEAANRLKSLLKKGLFKDIDLLQVVAMATVASLLLDVVSCTQKISESVRELASMAKFGSLGSALVDKQLDINDLHVIAME